MTAFDDNDRTMMVIDPVCGTQLDLDKATSQTLRDGWMYFFCSNECRKKFDIAPERYSVAAAHSPSSSAAAKN